jgi:hypothetical protein
VRRGIDDGQRSGRKTEANLLPLRLTETSGTRFAAAALTYNRVIVTIGKDDLDDEMLDAIVRRANENQALMDGTMQPVLSIMDAADIVVAIWQDMNQPPSIGLRVVKGHLLLQKQNFTTTKWRQPNGTASRALKKRRRRRSKSSTTPSASERRRTTSSECADGGV